MPSVPKTCVPDVALFTPILKFAEFKELKPQLIHSMFCRPVSTFVVAPSVVIFNPTARLFPKTEGYLVIVHAMMIPL